MKANTHPQWNNNTKVTCTCGNTFTTGSTQSTIDVDICSKCHPFFTGEMKFVDRQGRVDKFKKKMEEAKKIQELRKKALQIKMAQTQQAPTEEKSYQDILREKQAILRTSEAKNDVKKTEAVSKTSQQ